MDASSIFRIPLLHPEHELVPDSQLPAPSHQPSASALRADLSVSGLNEIDQYLGIAGSLDHYSPLHHQAVILRHIIPTQQARLHLVWFKRTIYIKPLPDYLLNAAYVSSVAAKDADLAGLVLGFLRSYARMLESPLDLTVAKTLHLVPDAVTWESWHDFRLAVLDHAERIRPATATAAAAAAVNKRYRYGELRLDRLNLIWRLQGRGLTYFTVHREYGTYFRQHFELLITGFAVATVVLSALQVLVGIADAPALLITVSYRFSIAVLVGVVGCISYIAVVFLLMGFYESVATAVAHMRK